MNKRLIIETYIAYQLCQKNILVIGEIGDGGLIDYIAEITGSTSKDSLSRYLRRCIEDFKTIEAMTSKARVRLVIDQSERDYWYQWEDEFYRPENIVYEGKSEETRRYSNLKISHLSPVDYTFTLGSYDLATNNNLRKLYRIVMTINSEYSDNKRTLSEKINSYLDQYIELFNKDDYVITDFIETIEYLKTAIKKEYDEGIDMYNFGSINPRDDFEDKMYDLENMFNDFKFKYGFASNPVELTSVERITKRRRQTEIKMPKSTYFRLLKEQK